MVSILARQSGEQSSIGYQPVSHSHCRAMPSRNIPSLSAIQPCPRNGQNSAAWFFRLTHQAAEENSKGCGDEPGRRDECIVEGLCGSG